MACWAAPRSLLCPATGTEQSLFRAASCGPVHSLSPLGYEFQMGHCCAGRILWTHRSAAVQVTVFLLLMVWAEKLCFLAGNVCCHTRGSQLALQGEEGACYQPGYQSPGSTVLQTTHPCGNDTSAPKPLQRTRQNTDEASAETCELELPSSVVARL